MTQPHAHSTYHYFGGVLRLCKLLLPFLFKRWRTRLATLVSLLLMAVDTASVTLAPWSFSKVVGAATEGTASLGYLKSMLWLWLLALVIRKNMPRLQQIILFEVINEAVKGVRLNLIKHLHRTPYVYWQKYQHTEVLSASTRVSMSVRGFMRASLLRIPTKVVKIILLLVSIAHALPAGYGMLFFVVPFGTTCLVGMLGILRFLRSRHSLWEVSDHVLVRSGDSLRNSKGVLFYMQSEHQALEEAFAQEAAGWRLNNLHQHGLLIVQNVVMVGSIAMVLLHMLTLLIEGAVTVEQVVLVQGYLLMLYKQVGYLVNQVRIVLCYAWDMRKVLAIFALPTYAKGLVLPHEHRGEVLVATDLQFSYQGKQTLLQGASLTIKYGEKVMLAGPSGGGKSTLCHLLAGLYLPQEGTVRIHGLETAVLNPVLTGKVLHFVDQEATLQVGNLVANLQTQAETQAGKQALGYLEHDLTRTLGEAGKGLSGGERQRLFLARCLAQHPQIVILDETFAYLDDESAATLFEILYREVPTVVMVNHRPSFAKYFDKVYHLEAGRLRAA